MSSTAVEEIKRRLDIVELVQSYIRLQKTGINYKATCPFHHEKTPSFVVSPSRQRWHCFGCGKGGGHIDFVMEMEGLDFKEALEVLAKRTGVELKREDPRLRSEKTRLLQLVEEAAKIFETTLHQSTNPERIPAPLAYMKTRGLTDETIKAWRIGFAPDSWDYLTGALQKKGYSAPEIEKAGLAVKSEQGNSHYDRFRNRIIFPIRDATGRVVGFGGRIFESANPGTTTEKNIAAKYINTPETPLYNKSHILFGFDRAREAIRKNDAVVLVEGYMDCIMSHQAGVAHAVAISGTALSPDQLKLLKRLAGTMVSSLDRDIAGEAATKRSMDLATTFGFDRKVALLADGMKDPADAVKADPALWQTAVAEAKPVVAFFLDSALRRLDAKTASGRRAISEMVLPEIRTLTSEVERAHWIQKLSSAINIDEAVLWRELKRAKISHAEPLSNSAAIPIAIKSRRTLLEELLLGTLVLYPEEAAGFPNLPRHAMVTEPYRELLAAVEALMPAGTHDALLAKLPEEYRQRADHLAFQAEVLLDRIENPLERKKELALVIAALEQEWARERMRDLTRDISTAEARGDQAGLTALLQEFGSVSSKIN